MKTLAFLLCFTGLAAAEPVSISGIYPGLAMFNDEGECGTGAVVPWAGKLWAITYAPHKPKGSTDKLYEISEGMVQTVRPESIGGTPANRMIHRESNQLFIGPYVIGAKGEVRVITPQQMFGRITGNARHLTDPGNKINYATMEEGIYEVDVHSLAVTELWADEQVKAGRHADLPGYHGKGFYSGFGQLIYANNGDHVKEALTNPETPSGVLATWDGKADKWSIVRRNQFTEVTGPGGIYGNEHPDKDPVWSIGWDHRSLILMMLDGGKWQAFRLPKASHCYDGAHGWNTEWPRIREIGDDFMMTMHGMFWHFPRGFSAANTTGIAPRSTYLKVVGDFCRWGDRVVLGCDDTAKSEFLNKGKLKGALAGPGQSQSNLRFLKPEQLDQFGPPLGRGAVWQDDVVKAGQWSDAFLFSGFAHRGVFLTHTAKVPVKFSFETNAGDGTWTKLRAVTVPAGKAHWESFGADDKGAWVRIKTDRDVSKASAVFHYSAEDKRTEAADPMFNGLASAGATNFLGGFVRTRGDNKRTLALAAITATDGKATDCGYYELDAELKLKHVDDAASLDYTKKATVVPEGVIAFDAASVLVVDDKGSRWRLPKGDAAFEAATSLPPMRVDREVCTERDLLNAFGTFYELPANNAGGFAKIRPITTHNRSIHDYCSYRGLLIMTGIATDAADNEHIIRSDDHKAAVWAGAVDDLWSLGKPRGRGGPWAKTAVKKGKPSDPYLMMGYDKKSLSLSASEAVTLRVEVDITGTGKWLTYRAFELNAGESVSDTFPVGYQAYWLRVVASGDCEATAQLNYE